MAGIFINYRRDDSRGLAGRLADNLRRAFGSRAVFMDVDGMKPGLISSSSSTHRSRSATWCWP